ncbi:MAG: molybdenum cofactor guanylyltransferase [Candidatus Thermoplasmatota archaeon]|nr:molybdenum cofactor guanylyltransferase [Candidatus Thermoplasmatota archaeon]
MLTGIVLSGGTGTRFGQEKGLVMLNDEPMVSRVVATMRILADEVVVAVADGRAEEYARFLSNDTIIVEDEREGIGPLHGLTTAMRAAGGDYVVVSPCDTPLLRPGVCRAVVDNGEGKDGAVPCIRGYLEPLHACYRRKICLGAFEQAVASGRRRPKDAYHLLDLATVDEEDLRRLDPHLESFINVNTQEDLAEVVDLISQR